MSKERKKDRLSMIHFDTANTHSDEIYAACSKFYVDFNEHCSEQ